MTQLAPSILNSNLANLEQEIKKIAKADWVHLDVMDGHFVPNLTFGPMFVTTIRQYTTLPVEAHLMVEKPESFVPLYAEAGCQRITVHAETSANLHRLVQQIKEYGCEAGLALNPATPLNCLDYLIADLDLVLLMTVNPGFGGQQLISSILPKIKELKAKLTKGGYSCKIEVDGGINWENMHQLIQAGVDVIVAGTLIYHDPNPEEAIARFRREF